MDTIGKLYLNGKLVGTLYRTGQSTCWGYGLFDPEEAFAEFAPLFACWASLMHASGEDREIDDRTLAELRVAECALDALKAKIFWTERNVWSSVSQLNIDVRLIEWKDGGECGSGKA